MRRWLVGSLAVTSAVFWLASIPVTGQAPPATSQADSPPRTSDGQPNLQGIWQVLNTAAWDIQDHSAQEGVRAGQGVVEGNEIPCQPWAAEKKERKLREPHDG